MDRSVLGKIEFVGYWSKRIELEMWRDKYSIDLMVVADEDPEFESSQVEAYREIMNHTPEIMKLCEEYLLMYYQENLLEYRERYGQEYADKYAPIISKEEDLKSIITPTAILIKESFGSDDRILGVLFDATCEPEHGVAVRFENMKIVEVGIQDIVL